MPFPALTGSCAPSTPRMDASYLYAFALTATRTITLKTVPPFVESEMTPLATTLATPMGERLAWTGGKAKTATNVRIDTQAL